MRGARAARRKVAETGRHAGGARARADGDHGAIYMWLLRQCMQQRPELDLLPDRGLRVEEYRKGRARPDGCLAPADHFVGSGEWVDPDGALMTVEITSADADTDRRDRTEKRDGYAAAGIPVYLLVDREPGAVVVYAEPEKGRYKSRRTHYYGDTVRLPEPVGITLHTEKLKDYA
ncbi:Uma2 family endonuclease [Streptomyces sp. WMMC1477]|uniref:Uma2 family endonuclease n=1 Tax=unclassified Streptomyces TaxID=2593676 RepID=UPI003FCE3A7C